MRPLKFPFKLGLILVGLQISFSLLSTLYLYFLGEGYVTGVEALRLSVMLSIDFLLPLLPGHLAANIWWNLTTFCLFLFATMMV